MYTHIHQPRHNPERHSNIGPIATQLGEYIRKSIAIASDRDLLDLTQFRFINPQTARYFAHRVGRWKTVARKGCYIKLAEFFQILYRLITVVNRLFEIVATSTH